MAVQVHDSDARLGGVLLVIIRWLLTMLLIFCAYTETGAFTALAFLLVFIALEMIARLQRRMIEDRKNAIDEWLERYEP